MLNQDIREAAYKAGVRLWEIADALGIADTSLSRKMRYEIPAEEKNTIFDAIEKIEQARKEASRGA